MFTCEMVLMRFDFFLLILLLYLQRLLGTLVLTHLPVVVTPSLL